MTVRTNIATIPFLDIIEMSTILNEVGYPELYLLSVISWIKKSEHYE